MVTASPTASRTSTKLNPTPTSGSASVTARRPTGRRRASSAVTTASTKMPTTANHGSPASTDPSTIEMAAVAPTTRTPTRRRRAAATPTIAAGRTPTAQAIPRETSSNMTTADGTAQTAPKSASDQSQASAGRVGRAPVIPTRLSSPLPVGPPARTMNCTVTAITGRAPLVAGSQIMSGVRSDASQMSCRGFPRRRRRAHATTYVSSVDRSPVRSTP